MKVQAIFFDRDGTLGGDGHFIHPRNFKLYDSAVKAFEILKSSSVKKFSFTNQHRISRGEVSVEEFEREFESYGFDRTYICPHKLNNEFCECQKPRSGMLLEASKEYQLDLSKCVVIGDLGSDMIAADKVNSIKILVKTGWGVGSITDYRYLWKDVQADYIAEDILDAINWLKSNYIL